MGWNGNIPIFRGGGRSGGEAIAGRERRRKGWAAVEVRLGLGPDDDRKEPPTA